MDDRVTGVQLAGIIKLNPEWLNNKVPWATNGPPLSWIDPSEAVEAYRLVLGDIPNIERIGDDITRYVWRVGSHDYSSNKRTWLCNHIANGVVAILMNEVLGLSTANGYFYE